MICSSLSDKLATFSIMVDGKQNYIKEEKYVWLMRINTNVSALRAQRAMSEHTSKIESAAGKISSGSRVRNASDDAASLSIGQKQKADIRSQYQAIRNANDAIGEFQVAEGAMSEISNILIRLKELSIQSASGHLQDTERGMANMEYMQLRKEAERIAQSTKLNGVNLLQNKSGQTRDFMIGINNDSNSKISLKGTELGVSEFNLNIIDSNISSVIDARLNIEYIDGAIEKLSAKRATAGAYQNKAQSAINNLEQTNVNETEAMSRTMDADMAYEASEKLRSEGNLKSASAVLSQSANFSAMALKLLK